MVCLDPPSCFVIKVGFQFITTDKAKASREGDKVSVL
jgi:hypothetical protein